MRLIDADELLSKLNEAYKKANAEYHRRALNGFWCGTCSALQEAIREVKEQPTAFDVDKVVEGLEAEQQKYAAQALETDDIDTVFRCAVNEVAMQTAIDIVKRDRKEQ